MLRVGRTEYADRYFPDTAMSRLHFQLDVDRDGCYVEDLKSANGTTVNDVRIKGKRQLVDGDEIVAGETSFLAIITGAPSATSEKPRISDAEISDADDGDVQPRSKDKTAHYTVEKCASGLQLCRGAIAELSPAELALRLSGEFHPYLIVDFKRVGQPLPQDMSPFQFLFDWLDPAVAAAVSPLLIAAEDMAVWANLVEAAWGKDALVCFFSEQEPAEVWAHLRRASRARVQGEKQVLAVLGFCWPGVLVSLLSHSAPHASQLCAGMNAVLTEFPDLPDTWQVYGGSELPATLEHLGLIQQPLNQPAAV